VARMRGARLGDPASEATDIGPVATEQQLAKTLGMIEVAKAEGAVCVLGGRRPEGEALKNGWFVEPTIFTGVNNSDADRPRGGLRARFIGDDVRFRR